MAISFPKKKYSSVKLKDRLDWLRKHGSAGTPREWTGQALQFRRGRYADYKRKHLPATNPYIKCYCCDKKGYDQWHHIVYLSRGGHDCPQNLVPLCLSCHKKVHRFDPVRMNREKKKELPTAFRTPVVGFVYIPPAKPIECMA